MKDPRIVTLAEKLVSYSVRVKEGEKVLIDLGGEECYQLGEELVKAVCKKKAIPFIRIQDSNIQNAFIQYGSKEAFEKVKQQDLEQMKQMDAYIAIRASKNIANASHISNEKMEEYEKEYMEEVLNERVDHTKWVILRYPNASMAQLASMNTEEFEDFYFQVCNLDYKKMDKAMDALQELMSKTDQVHIVGPGTDLHFSIKKMGAIKCAGEFNVPDGEVYTAPIKDSVNGTISYNAYSTYRNTTFHQIVFQLKNGKIIEAKANEPEKLNQILDTDEGARYIGEFAIGVNPYITKPMNDILFDEKIAGSFHFTPGRAYEDMNNGNVSSIHWDLVCIQTPEYGGGEIYFDDVLIRKDGRFVLPELEALNPENLK